MRRFAPHAGVFVQRRGLRGWKFEPWGRSLSGILIAVAPFFRFTVPPVHPTAVKRPRPIQHTVTICSGSDATGHSTRRSHIGLRDPHPHLDSHPTSSRPHLRLPVRFFAARSRRWLRLQFFATPPPSWTGGGGFAREAHAGAVSGLRDPHPHLDSHPTSSRPHLRLPVRFLPRVADDGCAINSLRPHPPAGQAGEGSRGKRTRSEISRPKNPC